MASLMKLSKAIGAIIGRLAIYCQEIHEIPVSEWKGRQSKVYAQLNAKQYGVTQKDAADAIAMGEWWLSRKRKCL